MTAQLINLAELRADVQQHPYRFGWRDHAPTLLALIDVAEAAQQHVDEYVALDHPSERRRKVRKLANTLARFTADTTSE